MPAAACSSMWQWSNHFPELSATNEIWVVCAGPTHKRISPRLAFVNYASLTLDNPEMMAVNMHRMHKGGIIENVN